MQHFTEQCTQSSLKTALSFINLVKSEKAFKECRDEPFKPEGEHLLLKGILLWARQWYLASLQWLQERTQKLNFVRADTEAGQGKEKRQEF